jgi:DNA-binding LacI/PurR family transcriptional regulator
MNFDNKEILSVLKNIPNQKLLLIDWKIYSKPKNNFVFQDFGKAFYDSLTEAIDLLKKYKEIVFVYPSYTNHPKESLTFFKKFIKDYNLNHSIITNANDFNIEENKAYISVSDRILGVFLEQCKEKNLEPGKDIGFLSYNETPMKKFIYKGISVISTNFKELGTKGAEFITKEEPMQHFVSTNLIIRESL